ncbi:MAG: HDOD domain-containing protein [Persephonella sp.]|nr:HDOD domain-containing protein [Persephonella sp.]
MEKTTTRRFNYFLMIRGIQIAKQQIYTKDRKPVGYELFFRGSIDDHFKASLITFNYLMENSKNRYYVFLNVNDEFIFSEIPDLTDNRTKIVFEIVEDTPLTDRLLKRIKRLKEKGALFSINNFDFSKHAEFVEFLDFAKLNIVDNENVFRSIKLLRDYRVKSVAFKIENEIFYKIAQQLGFEYFQGFFLSVPQEESFDLNEHNYKVIIKVLNSVINMEPPENVEEYLKLAPKLVTKLLIYINSAYFGFRTKISSIRRIISVLGYKNLEKWLLFQLFYSRKELTILLEKASFRGKIMELIASQTQPEMKDEAFLTGMLSVIGNDRLVKEVNLDEKITDALYKKRGFLGELLRVIENLENGQFENLHTIMRKYNLSPQKLMEYELQAFSWFENIKEQVESVQP